MFLRSASKKRFGSASGEALPPILPEALRKRFREALPRSAWEALPEAFPKSALFSSTPVFTSMEEIYRGEPSALHPALEAAGGRAEDLGFGV